MKVKMSKEELARREGMAYALRIAKEKGIEGLEAELKMRNVGNIPVGLEKSALDEFCRRVKCSCTDTILILSCVTLRDQFDFGKERIGRFIERFNKKAECIADDYASWEDMREILLDELDIDLGIRENDENIKV